MAYRVLLVEDSLNICEGIVDSFKSKAGDNFIIDVFNNGADAITNMGNYDIAYLDIMLPGASGFDVCMAIRKKSDCPIIFLTAIGTEETILKGYDLGADDYIIKPFSFEQLFAKTNALLRRSSLERKPVKRLVLDEIELDPVGMRVYVDGKEISTTAKEYFLLKAFMENQGMILSREQLLSRVWGSDFDGSDRVVDTHIKKLRKLLGNSSKHIKTEFGRGYKIL